MDIDFLSFDLYILRGLNDYYLGTFKKSSSRPSLLIFVFAIEELLKFL